MNSAAITIFSSELRARQPLACRLFESAIGQAKIANAYLLVGRATRDKLVMARQLASYLNCLNPARATKGACHVSQPDVTKYCLNCQWIAKDEHPQAWLNIAGEGKSQKIPVEKVRVLTDELAKTSSFVRVVVVPESDEVTFHRPAANALLKSIEEPPENCLFFFFADSVEEVLATIVSRCQVVPLHESLKLGYWLEPPGRDALPVEVKTQLESARAAFIMNARRHFGSAGAGSQPYVRAVAESIDLSKHLLDLSKQLQEHMEERQIAELLVDLMVACEIEVVREQACVNPELTRYIARVLAAGEKTKRQIEHYVKPSNAIECFSLELNELRLAQPGDTTLAKR